MCIWDGMRLERRLGLSRRVLQAVGAVGSTLRAVGNPQRFPQLLSGGHLVGAGLEPGDQRDIMAIKECQWFPEIEAVGVEEIGATESCLGDINELSSSTGDRWNSKAMPCM